MAGQADHTDELETLRRTNSELVSKNSTRKQRITELEQANAELQTKLTAANAEIYEYRIGAPLKVMAESISTVPDAWVENFNKSYRLELVNGELTILSAADGKAVEKAGKPLPFERRALIDLLTDKDHPQSKLFNAITIASHASGAQGTTERKPTPKATVPKVKFGLR